MSENRYDELMAVLLSRIRLVPKEDIAPFLKEALDFSPDKDDSPFLALCLAREIPLWSNDKPLKERQSVVRVLSTGELFNAMKKK